MRCPACQEPLVVVEREGIEVDWCAACGGIWFDAGELELLAEVAQCRLELAFAEPPGTAPATPAAPSSRRCPRCTRRLEERPLALEPPIAIDFCPRGHGLWFDRGELGGLVRSLPRLAERTPAREVANFLGEVFRAETPGAPAT